MRTTNKPAALKLVLTLMTLSATALLPAYASTTSTYYMSVGKNGEKKFSQFAPRTGNYEAIEIRSDGRFVDKGDMAGRTAKGQATADELAKEQELKVKQAQIDEYKQRENAQKCQTLRNNLANLRIGGRMYEMDENGQRKYLDDSAMREKQERTQQAINKFCSGQAT